MAKVPGVAAAVPMLRTSVGKPSERVVLLGVDDNIRAMLSDLQRAVQDQIGPLGHSSPAGSRSEPARATRRATRCRWATARSPSRPSSAAPMPTGSTAANFIVGPLPLIQHLTDRAE